MTSPALSSNIKPAFTLNNRDFNKSVAVRGGVVTLSPDQTAPFSCVAVFMVRVETGGTVNLKMS